MTAKHNETPTKPQPAVTGISVTSDSLTPGIVFLFITIYHIAINRSLSLTQ